MSLILILLTYSNSDFSNCAGTTFKDTKKILDAIELATAPTPSNTNQKLIDFDSKDNDAMSFSSETAETDYNVIAENLERNQLKKELRNLLAREEFSKSLNGNSREVPRYICVSFGGKFAFFNKEQVRVIAQKHSGIIISPENATANLSTGGTLNGSVSLEPTLSVNARIAKKLAPFSSVCDFRSDACLVNFIGRPVDLPRFSTLTQARK